MTRSRGIDLDDIQLFCNAAEHRNFTESAIAIGVTPSAVSKGILRLERRLGVRLFHRSTRSMRLTEEGKSYYRVCKEAVESIEAIEAELMNYSEPRGILKISMPNSYGAALLPHLSPFIEEQSSQLSLEFSFNNAYINFNRDDYDLAIRIGPLNDDRLVAKYLHSTTPIVVASPSYLERWGKPERLEELQHHRLIGIKFPSTPTPLPWLFGEAQEEYHFRPYLIHSHSLGAVESVIEGAGILQMLDYAVATPLKEGRLVELFPHLRPPKLSIHAVYPSSHYIPAKTRLFLDYLFTLFK